MPEAVMIPPQQANPGDVQVVQQQSVEHGRQAVACQQQAVLEPDAREPTDRHVQ
jgi:hypothetical protein